jgi:hypothetical protein
MPGLFRSRAWHEGQGPSQSNGMCLAEFSVYSNLKPCASTERIVDFPQVTSCGPGPVSLPGAFISCGYFPGGLVGPLIALAQALTLPMISTPNGQDRVQSHR